MSIKMFYSELVIIIFIIINVHVVNPVLLNTEFTAAPPHTLNPTGPNVTSKPLE